MCRRHPCGLDLFLPRRRTHQHGGFTFPRGTGLARALTEVSPLELLEQAVSLLRAAPSHAWNYYVAGSAPLLAAVVYCVAGASVHPISADEIELGAAALTALFLWMSWTKIRFASLLQAQLSGEHGKWSGGATWVTAAFQGMQLIVVPLSLLAVFPFAWSVAFFGSLNALAERPHRYRASARMAGLWQRQNWFALGLVAVFAFVVFLNVAMLLLMLPTLARMFSGYENEFTRHPAAMLNWTFAATAFGVTWFAIDPLVQAMYVVRCFKGESVGSGADLRAALRRLAVALVVVFVTAATAQARTVTPSELDSKIRHTLQGPDYYWQNPEAPAGDSPRWMEDLSKLARRVGHWIRVAVDWVGAQLRELLRSSNQPVVSGAAPPKTSLRWAIYAAMALIAILALLILQKALSTRTTSNPASSATTAAVDLKGDVIASELPEDEWLRLAREALDRGDLRLALRAAYLANLAWLGSAGLIAISRFKSNRDYERELRLRSRSDELTVLLKTNREVFESAWYGDENKTPADVEDMQRNLAKMRELAHA
jgi:hypothetical protein